MCSRRQASVSSILSSTPSTSRSRHSARRWAADDVAPRPPTGLRQMPAVVLADDQARRGGRRDDRAGETPHRPGPPSTCSTYQCSSSSSILGSIMATPAQRCFSGHRQKQTAAVRGNPRRALAAADGASVSSCVVLLFQSSRKSSQSGSSRFASLSISQILAIAVCSAASEGRQAPWASRSRSAGI